MMLEVPGAILKHNLERVKKQLEAEIEELKIDRIDRGKSSAMVLSQLDGVEKLRRVNELLYLTTTYYIPGSLKFYLDRDDIWIMLPRERITHKFSHEP